MKTLRWILGALCWAQGWTATEPAPPTSGPLVELPEFVVKERADLPEPDPWLYTATPGLEVVSTASVRTTRGLLERLMLFDAALRLVWPLPAPGSDAGLQLVVCGRNGDFARFAEETKETAPLSGRVSLLLPGKPSVLVVDAYTKALPFASQNFIRLPLRQGIFPSREPEEEEELDPEMDWEDGSQTYVDLTRQLCREYVRHVLSRSTPRLAPWVEEGIAQIMSHGEVTRRSITFARLTPASELSPGDEGDFLVALKHQRLMPFGQFFAVGRDDAEVRNPIGSLWVHQAHAFAHLCFYGAKGKYRRGFELLARHAARGPVTEEIFRQCFGAGYREMENALDDYIAFPRFAYARLTLGKDEGLAPVVLPEPRPATTDEVGALVGGALLRAGRPGDALREWRLAYARGAKGAGLLTTLAAAESAAGREARALELSQKAVTAATKDPAPYLAVVRAQLAAAPAGPLSVPALRTALGVLFAARQNVPPAREIYLAIAQVWQRSAVPPRPGHLGVLHEGLGHFPDDVDLLTATAELEHLAGRDAEMEALIERALGLDLSGAQRAALERLRWSKASGTRTSDGSR